MRGVLLPNPIHELPPTYQEVEHLVVTEGGRLLWLNLLSLIPLALAIVGVNVWWQWVVSWRGSLPGDLHWLIGLPLALLVLLLHELIHAAVILLVGHKPRLGAKLDKGVLYATADGAYFRRSEFIAVALAPLVVITLAGLALIALLPDRIGFYVSLAVILNAGGAIGDLWMAWVVLRHAPSVLVRDEEDGIRVFAALQKSA